MILHVIEDDLAGETWLEASDMEIQEGLDLLLARRAEFHEWLVANERL